MRFELSLRKCGSCRVTSERLIVKKESDKDTQKKHRENAVVFAVVALFLRVDSSCGAGAPSSGRDTLDLLSTGFSHTVGIHYQHSLLKAAEQGGGDTINPSTGVPLSTENVMLQLF